MVGRSISERQTLYGVGGGGGGEGPGRGLHNLVEVLRNSSGYRITSSLQHNNEALKCETLGVLPTLP